MSTVAEAPSAPTNAVPWSQPAANVRPRVAITGVMKGLEDPKTTGDGSGDYERAKITFEPTRGSKKCFPAIMWRNEMFSVGYFDVAKHYRNNPTLAVIPEGKSRPLGESFATVYGMNTFPRVETDANGVPKVDKKTGLTRMRQTPLTALCGGTLEGLMGFYAVLQEAMTTIKDRAPGELGIPELTSEEIANLLRGYIASKSPVEQVFILKQAKDQNGDLSDNYEMDEYLGPLSAATHKIVTDRAAKNANAATEKRLQVGYSV